MSSFSDDDNNNIDDILNDIAVDTTTPQETRDLQELTRCWVAERVAPELLPWPEELVERVLARIRRQIELVEDQTAMAGMGDARTGFRLIVVQTELERFKFLVRGFLRSRLRKIDTHPLHVLHQHTDSLASPHPLLSTAEHQYLTTHQSLLAAHYHASFLSQFPASLQRLDDTTGGISMVDRPDEDAAIFVRCLRDVGEVLVEGTDARMDLKRGDVWVVRWSAVRRWVEVGDLEVI